MAGTRRGSDRKEASDAFEAASPFLTRVDTHIEVVKDGEGKKAPYIAQVTQEGQVVESDTDISKVKKKFTLANEVETDVGDLQPYDPDAQKQKKVDLVLSDYGFGVDNRKEKNGKDFALDGEEELQFIMPASGVIEPGVLVFGEEFFFRGGLDFEIDYVVLGGSGTVEIELLEYLPFVGKGKGNELENAFLLGTASSGTVSGDGTTGSLEAAPDESLLFNAAVISVTGDLEIGVTGIDMTTNFAGDPFFGVPI